MLSDTEVRLQNLEANTPASELSCTDMPQSLDTVKRVRKGGDLCLVYADLQEGMYPVRGFELANVLS